MCTNFKGKIGGKYVNMWNITSYYMHYNTITHLNTSRDLSVIMHCKTKIQFYFNLILLKCNAECGRIFICKIDLGDLEGLLFGQCEIQTGCNDS